MSWCERQGAARRNIINTRDGRVVRSRVVHSHCVGTCRRQRDSEVRNRSSAGALRDGHIIYRYCWVRRKLHTKDGIVTACEIIKTTVIPNLNINRKTECRREIYSSVGWRWIKWIENFYPAGTEISEEVLADELCGKRRRRRIVESAASDRARRGDCRRILIQRIRHSCCSARAFTSWPPEICSGSSHIHFFPCALTDVVDVHTTGARLEAEREWIAKTGGPDRTISAGRRTRDVWKARWVIRRNRSIRIDSQYLAEAVC